MAPAPRGAGGACCGVAGAAEPLVSAAGRLCTERPLGADTLFRPLFRGISNTPTFRSTVSPYRIDRLRIDAATAIQMFMGGRCVRPASIIPPHVSAAWLVAFVG
jgi:hypothetical protein